MLTAITMGWLLGVGSVFAAAWTRMRLHDYRLQQRVIAMRQDRAAVDSVAVAWAMRRHKP